MKKTIIIIFLALILSAALVLLFADIQKTVTITLLGDVLPYHWPVHKKFKKLEKKNGMQAVYDYQFEKVKPLFEGIVFCNLEGPLTDRGPVKFKDKDEISYFSMPKKYIGTLRSAGITAVSVANNHIKDCGVKGLKDTILVLDEAGIAHTGAGANEEEAKLPAILRTDGRETAFIAYDLIKPVSVRALSSTAGAAYAEKEELTRTVRELSKKYDSVIVSLHWGKEYKKDSAVKPPEAERELLARSIIDAGAAVVAGTHSHAVERIEKYKHGLIAYGLGNFAFAATTREGHQYSMILKVRLSGKKVIAYEIIPVYISPKKAKYQTYPAEGPEKDELLKIITDL